MTTELSNQAPFIWQKSQWQQLTQQFSRGSLAHAYLIQGESGLGKSGFVRNLARWMLCQDQGIDQACGECRDCLLGEETNHPDISVVTVEEGSKEIKIEQIRALSSFLSMTSHTGGAKIAIIEKAERLNTNAANALLKTLEEPSKNTYLFLVSELPGRLKATIRSRCQKLLFNKPSDQLSRDWIRDQIDPMETDARIQELHLAAGGRPLLAVELSCNSVLDERRDFLKGVIGVGLGSSSPQTLVAMGAKTGELSILEHFAEFLSIFIKRLGGVDAVESNAGEIELGQLIPASEIAVKNRLIRLLTFRKEVTTAINQLQSGSNPNPQLLLESVFWQWQELFREFEMSAKPL